MTNAYRRPARLCAGLAFAVAVPASAVAADATAGWQAVGDDVLADARGGYDAGSGLLVSLAVDRMLAVNGNVLASGRLTVPDAARAAAGMSGAGVADALPAALALQNSASGQLIQARTTIDAAVNTLGVLKNLNFGDSLRQALSTAVAPR